MLCSVPEPHRPTAGHLEKGLLEAGFADLFCIWRVGIAHPLLLGSDLRVNRVIDGIEGSVQLVPHVNVLGTPKGGVLALST